MGCAGKRAAFEFDSYDAVDAREARANFNVVAIGEVPGPAWAGLL